MKDDEDSEISENPVSEQLKNLSVKKSDSFSISVEAKEEGQQITDIHDWRVPSKPAEGYWTKPSYEELENMNRKQL